MVNAEVIFDGRWSGDHGIGRFAREVSSRLPWSLETIDGAHPVSMRGLAELDTLARRAHKRTGASHFLSPGYCPPLRWQGSLSFTIHDLIHLDVPGEQSALKTLYYERVVRPAARRAQVVYTVSEFSRGRIVEWCGVAEERVIVVGNGVDEKFFSPGPGPGRARPYVLHVGNHKPHKNLARLIAAFALVRDSELELVITGAADPDLLDVAGKSGVSARVAFVGQIPEDELPGWYRGARVVAIPSLHEGFGLPALEAMAAAVPVVASNCSALPEVVGDLGVLIDPLDVESIANGLERAASDTDERRTAVGGGPGRARRFTWDAVAGRLVRGTAVV